MLLAILFSAFHISSTGLSEADCDWIFDPKPGILTADDRKIADAIYNGILERFPFWDLEMYARLNMMAEPNQSYGLFDREMLSNCASALGRIYNSESVWSFLTASSSLYPSTYDDRSFDWTQSSYYAEPYWARIFACFGTSKPSSCHYPSRGFIEKWNNPLASFYTSFADPYYQRSFNYDSFKFGEPYNALPMYFRSYAPYSFDTLSEIAERLKDYKKLSYKLDRPTLGALALAVAAIDGKLGDMGAVLEPSGNAWGEMLKGELVLEDSDGNHTAFNAYPRFNESGEIEVVVSYFNANSIPAKFTTRTETWDLDCRDEITSGLYFPLVSPYRRTMRTSASLSAVFSASAPWHPSLRELFQCLYESYGSEEFLYDRKTNGIEIDFSWQLNRYVGQVKFSRSDGTSVDGREIVIPAAQLLRDIGMVRSVFLSATGIRSATFERSDSRKEFIDTAWAQNERLRKYRFAGTVAGLREGQTYIVSTNYYSKLSTAIECKNRPDFVSAANEFQAGVEARTDSLYFSRGGLDDISTWTISERDLSTAISSITNFNFRVSSQKVVLSWDPVSMYNCNPCNIYVNGSPYLAEHGVIPAAIVTIDSVANYTAEEQLPIPSSWQYPPRYVEAYGSTFFMPIRFFDYQYLKLRKDED